MLSATQDFSSLGVRCIHWQSKASLIVSVSMDMSIMKLWTQCLTNRKGIQFL